MRILGGSTTDTLQLILYSPKYVIVSQYKNEQLKFNVNTHGISQDSKLGRIPFIRGLYIYLSKYISGKPIEINLNEIIFL